MWCLNLILLTLPVAERNLFTRERNDGLYLVVTYLLSKMVDELMLTGLASLGVSAFVFYGERDGRMPAVEEEEEER